MKDVLKEVFGSAVAFVRGLYTQNPVRVVAVVTSAIIAIVAYAGVGVDSGQTATVVAVILSILFGGEVSRQKVTPVAKKKKRA